MNKKNWGASALLALFLLSMSSRTPAACKVAALEIPVTMVGFRAIATLGINGTDIPLIVDSGAFYSFLTHAAAQQLELDVDPLPYGMRIEGLTGRIEASRTQVKRLKLLGGEIPDVEFIVGGNGENGAMGLLGRNILAITDIEYDLGAGSIRLMFPNEDCDGKKMGYWAGDKAVAELELLRDEQRSKIPPIQAIAKLNDKAMRVLLDTGAQSIVSLRAAKRAGITDMKPAGKVRGAGRGEANAWTATAEKFELGDEAISNIRVIVADFEQDQDMLLGIDFFLSHRIYISKKQRRMYFTYNGGSVFALNAIERAIAGATDLSSAPGPASTEEPTDAAGYARRGAASAARLDFAHALADLDRACAMTPQLAEYFVRRAAVHEMMQQWQPALKDLDAALLLEPANTEARLRRAWLRAGANDGDGTVFDLQFLDSSLAPQAHQRLEMGDLYEKFDLTRRALPQWTLWISAHPHDAKLASTLNSRCWAKMKLNIELDQALDDCDKAIDLQDQNGHYYDSRAWLRLRRGELRKALADFERALKHLPDSPWSLYGRSIVRRKLGDAPGAQADIQAARKHRPTIDDDVGRQGLAAEPEPLHRGGASSS